MAPSWGNDGGDTRRTLGEQERAEAIDKRKIYFKLRRRNMGVCIEEQQIFCHTDPGLLLIVSGTPVFVGVVAVQGKGDLGVPGVFGVGVVGVGDMGLEHKSCPASRHPGVLPPSLLPDF